MLRELIYHQYERYNYINEQVGWFDNKLNHTIQNFDNAKLLTSPPGFGPLTSQSVAVCMGSGQQFKTGRDAFAAMGFVPKQNSAGRKTTRLDIIKRGNTYIRSLLTVHSARAALRRAKFKSDKLSLWL